MLQDFIEDLRELCSNHDVVLQGKLSVSHREDYLGKLDFSTSIEYADRLPSVPQGTFENGKFLKFGVSYTEPYKAPHETEFYYGGIGIDPVKLNPNARLPSDYKNLVNAINKKHKGVGGF